MRPWSCDPSIEVIGQSVLSFIENLQQQNIQPILHRHNLGNIQPDVWYPAQKFLDVMNDLAKESNLSSNLVAIGMALVEHIVMPPGTENLSLPEILEQWDGLYKLQHRGSGELGSIITEKVNDKHYITILSNFYPDDLEYGLAYGFARRFLPRGTNFTVKYDENEKRRDEGGERTKIHIMWQ